MLTEMAQEYVLQTRMPETAYGSSTLVIAQMSMSLADTHLQFMRIGTGDKHIHVIICLDNDSISLGRV